MSKWSEEFASRIGREMKKRRTQLGLSVQEVADRCVDLGHPITRSTLAAMETGRRGDKIPIGDVMIVSQALRMPLALLLYPEYPDGLVEVLPGVMEESNYAADVMIGRIFPDGADVLTPEASAEKNKHFLDFLDAGKLMVESSTLEKVRDAYLEARDMYREYNNDGEMEIAEQFRKSAVDLLRQVREQEEKVRSMGGVINENNLDWAHG